MIKYSFFLFAIIFLSSFNNKPAQSNSTDDIPKISVMITENSFIAPDSIKAGYNTISFLNSTEEMHSAHLIKLDDSYTTEQLIKAYADSMQTGGERPKWMTHRGGVISEPGRGEVTLLLEPGNYTWVCVMGDDSAPHFAGHEHKSVIVYGKVDQSIAIEPADVTINMTDTNLELDRTISRGKQSIEIINTGTKYHLTAISRLNNNATAEDLISWYNTYNGPPPAKGVIATSAIGPGLIAKINVDLEPGNYAIHCMANAEGRFHLLDGAITLIKVE